MHEVKDNVEVKPNVLHSVLKSKSKEGNNEENSKNKRVVFQDKAVILNKSPPKVTDASSPKPATQQDKPKDKKDRVRPPTKVVVRRLPPSLTLEAFVDCVSPLPEHDYIYFVAADMSLGPNAFSRVYINFVNMADLITFHEQFDNYVFMDNKGNEYPAVVEFAPFQRIPKKRLVKKKDLKAGTLNDDPEYIAFLEILKEKKEANAAKHSSIDILIPSDKAAKKVTSTPLLDYIKQRRAEQQRIRDEKREERRKKELERRRIREEEKKKRKDGDSVLKVLRNSETEEGEEEKIVKDSKDIKDDTERQSSPQPQQNNKKKEDDRPKYKDKEKKDRTTDIRTRDTKGREGGPKSYRDERQKLAEGRMHRKLLDDQRKKTVGQSSSKTIDSRRSQELDKQGGIKEVPSRKTQMYSKESEGKKFSNDKFKENDKQLKDTDSKKSYNSRDFENKRSERYQGYEYRKNSYNSDTKKLSHSGNDSSSRNRLLDNKTKLKDSGSNQTKKSKTDATSGLNGEDADVDEKWEQMGAKPKVKTKTAKEDDDILSENDDSESIPKSEENVTMEKSLPIETMEFDKNITVPENEGLEVEIIDITVPEADIQDYEERAKINESKDTKEESFEQNIGARFDISSDRSSLIKTKRCLTVSKSQEFDISTNSETVIFERRNSLDSKSRRETAKINKVDKEWLQDAQEVEKQSDDNDEREWQVRERRDKLESKDNRVDPRSSESSLTDTENKRDPRVERRIRNKDRPSMEIYRPGMGRFSMQRKEREKGTSLGSSIEQDSPSTSPSPSPSIRPTSVTRNKPGQELRSMTFKRSVSREK